MFYICSEKETKMINDMLKNQFIYVLLVSLLWPALSNGQARQLSLSEALSLADENNLNAKSSEARMEAAKASYRMTNSVFLPGLTVSHTVLSPLALLVCSTKSKIILPTPLPRTLFFT